MNKEGRKVVNYLRNKKTAKNSPLLLMKANSIIYKSAIPFFLVILVMMLMTTDAQAALFSQLTESGSKIFEGMKTVIYAVAGFGIIGIAIGGFFGNLNWKWLSAIIIGLLVIAMTAGILSYMTESDLKDSSIEIQDSLKNAE